MCLHEFSIDVEACLVIDSPKMQHDASSLPVGGNADAALIPDARDEVGEGNAGQLAFRAEGNEDVVRKTFAVVPTSLITCLREVEGVGPCAVEVQPL